MTKELRNVIRAGSLLVSVCLVAFVAGRLWERYGEKSSPPSDREKALDKIEETLDKIQKNQKKSLRKRKEDSGETTTTQGPSQTSLQVQQWAEAYDALKREMATELARLKEGQEETLGQLQYQLKGLRIEREDAKKQVTQLVQDLGTMTQEVQRFKDELEKVRKQREQAIRERDEARAKVDADKKPHPAPPTEGGAAQPSARPGVAPDWPPLTDEELAEANRRAMEKQTEEFLKLNGYRSGRDFRRHP